jgi:tetratricopeptide (TPR) repeat protein
MNSSPPPAAPTDAIRPPAEATLLAQAIRTLRVDGDAGAALNLLDQRQTRFADGALSPEASAVRIEALLRLGRADAALADLDRLPLHAMPRRDEWHVVRGELRAQAGRWSSAEADFATALGHLPGAGGDLAERALWGRAVARSYQGSVANARADALEYLRRFPSGRFAGLAHQALLAP